jgi:hypothetical protein
MRAWGVDAAEPIVTDPGSIRVEAQEVPQRAAGRELWRRRGSPLVMGSLFAIAAIGAALLYFVLDEGSLTGVAPFEAQPKGDVAARSASAQPVRDVKMTDAATAPDLPR